MKKLLRVFVLAALAVAFTFVSCDDDDNGNGNGNNNDTPKKENNLLSGSVTSTMQLSADIEYQLTGPLIVEEGGVLEIPAGTVIKAQKGFSKYILVLQGGKINARGTAEKPIKMIGDKENAGEGYWGGLVINGRAPLADPAEKGSTEVNSAYTYGGNNPSDNSGVITYLILGNTGARSSADVEHNGLTLNGVGNGTKIENLYIYDGADDGIEFFGGSVNVKNLLVVNSDDVNIGVIIHHPFQCQVFILWMHHVINMAYIAGPLVFSSNGDFNRFIHVVPSDLSNLLGHRGREKQHTSFIGNIRQYLIDILRETHVEHLIRFVKNHGSHVFKGYGAPFNQVDKPSRGSHDDMYPTRKRPDLAFDAGTTIYRQYFYPFHVNR
jgi:hypothetical protein